MLRPLLSLWVFAPRWRRIVHSDRPIYRDAAAAWCLSHLIGRNLSVGVLAARARLSLSAGLVCFHPCITRLTVEASCCRVEDFEMNASAPTHIAVLGISWTLKNTILTDGAMDRIFAAASNPFIPGMLRSRITTSGDSRGTIQIASMPFWASPHTSIESLLANSVRTPLRTISWSSTIRTR